MIVRVLTTRISKSFIRITYFVNRRSRLHVLVASNRTACDPKK